MAERFLFNKFESDSLPPDLICGLALPLQRMIKAHLEFKNVVPISNESMRIVANGLFVLLCLLTVQTTFAQEEVADNGMNLQFGVSARCVIQFAVIKKETHPIVHLAINGGVGSNFISPEIHPTLNCDIQLYNGGFGSAKPDCKKPRLIADFTTALTVTFGYNNRWRKGNEMQEMLNPPLYYFSNFTYPSLRNPFQHSVSIGTNIIFTTDPWKDHQRIGFFNAHAERFQISYYNDGGVPFYQAYLGDRRDRYYTGGGLISYHGYQGDGVNLIEVGYNKFTGYARNAFELSNELDLAYVDYNDERQSSYNRSQLTVTVANPHRHWGAAMQVNNYPKLDAQHLIHWFLYDSYHISPYKGHVSFSGQYYHFYTQIGLR